MDNNTEKKILTEEELKEVAGGNDGLLTRKVCGLEKGFLAVRSQPEYDPANELGCLFNGDYVYSTERYSNGYVWAYAECPRCDYYGKRAYSGYGWINCRFLTL